MSSSTPVASGSQPSIANPIGCTNSPPYANRFYPTSAPLYRDASGYCLPYNSRGEVVRYAQYGYDPGVAVGIVFLVLFAILLIGHLGINFMSRRKWLYVISIGAAGEVIGWAGRLMSGFDNGYSDRAHNAFLIQIICLTLAPVFFSGALYGLQVLVAYVHPASSRVTSKKLAWGFVAADILSLILQGAGGGIAAQAQTTQKQQTGTRMMVGGIVFQAVILVVFTIIGIDMVIRGRRSPLQNPALGLKLRRLAIGMALADATLLIRGIYRAIELAQGWSGYLITHEPYFIALDAVMMLVCLVVLAWAHPHFTLPLTAGTVSAVDLVHSSHPRHDDAAEKASSVDRGSDKVV